MDLSPRLPYNKSQPQKIIKNVTILNKYGGINAIGKT